MKITKDTKIALLIDIEGKTHQVLLQDKTEQAIKSVIFQLEGKITVLEDPIEAIEIID
jgi:hypothetical protein